MSDPLTVSLHRPYRAPSLITLSILGLTPQAVSHHPFGALDFFFRTRPLGTPESRSQSGRYNGSPFLRHRCEAATESESGRPVLAQSSSVSWCLCGEFLLCVLVV